MSSSAVRFPAPKSGFTLGEVLLGCFLVSLAMSLAIRLYFTLNRQAARLESRQQIAQQFQRLMTHLRADIRTASAIRRYPDGIQVHATREAGPASFTESVVRYVVFGPQIRRSVGEHQLLFDPQPLDQTGTKFRVVFEATASAAVRCEVVFLDQAGREIEAFRETVPYDPALEGQGEPHE